jgi:hypothetical protein
MRFGSASGKPKGKFLNTAVLKKRGSIPNRLILTAVSSPFKKFIKASFSSCRLSSLLLFVLSLAPDNFATATTAFATFLTPTFDELNALYKLLLLFPLYKLPVLSALYNTPLLLPLLVLISSSLDEFLRKLMKLRFFCKLTSLISYYIISIFFISSYYI